MHPLSTYSLTGLVPVESSPNPHSLETGSTASPDGLAGLLHPQNPLFWVGGLLAVTVGLIGLSGSVRVGKARVSGSIDKEGR